MRVVTVFNHTRSIGKFRATAPARDKSSCGCGCGGKGLCGHAHDSEQMNMSIDVRYRRQRDGTTETRHYTIPGVITATRGSPPSRDEVGNELRTHPDHIAMLRSGWSVDKAEGYYKR